MNPPDLRRLQATLGDPRLARLLTLLRRRLELDTPLTGAVTLTGATGAERAAFDELLGRRPTKGETLTLDLEVLAGTLREAGISDDLRSAVEALLGPVTNRRAAGRERDNEWAACWGATRDRFAMRPVLASWLDELARSGMVKRLCADNPAIAHALLRDVWMIMDALPAAAEPLASLAARLIGDAHGLDPGTARATLAVRAAARLGGIEFEDDAEGRRAAWAGVGVMCDELSTPALVLNLPATDGNPLGRLLQSARAAGEPVHLSLRLLLRYPLGVDSGLAGRAIFVCENPTLVALAADRLGRRCAPLVCVNGQFATPSLVLLRQLREAGARLHYHGDFDPAGLAIARRALAESGGRPWRFGAGDYMAAPKGEKFMGEPGLTPWDESLREAMRNDGRAVHEEAVFPALAEDLARGGNGAI